MAAGSATDLRPEPTLEEPAVGAGSSGGRGRLGRSEARRPTTSATSEIDHAVVTARISAADPMRAVRPATDESSAPTSG